MVPVLLGLLETLLPLGYLLVVLAYLVLYVQEPPWAVRTAPWLARGLVAVHAGYLLLLTTTFEHVPVAGMWEAFTFVAFALAAVYLVLEAWLGNAATGVFLLTPPLVFQILSSALMTPTREVPELLRTSGFGWHVTAALLGFAAFAIAAVYGVLYVLLYRSLKRGRVGLVFQRLPSLDVLADLNWRALVFGWLNLTLAIGLGVLWVNRLASEGQLTGSFVQDPKFISSVVVWLLYSVCLGGRLLFHWPSRRLAAVAIVAFVMMLASSISVNLFLESFHTFG